VTGKETVPGPSQYQHHITGTVAFSLNLARILGQADPLESQRILREADGFYEARSEPGIDGLRHIRDTMSPDENHIGDDDLYTNLLATWSSHNGRWKPSPSPYALPQDDKSFLTYQKDAQKGYKQAAAVLAIYPLQFPAAESQARVMMDRFADKVSKNGPAMSDSVHALIWARLGERERAYETWQSSWKDFHFPPHGLFSEKRRSDRTVFLTGMGGCLQTVIYGLLGFRIDSKPLPDAVWSQKLIGENWLSVKPNLPPAWKRVTFRNFAVLGQKRTLVATASGATVTPE
jgi:trehalose/maltose hydrolase-like predicted phosphorylase